MKPTKDGKTRKLARRSEGDFLETHRASLTVLSGPGAGSEYILGKPRLTLGRGPGVDLSFDDPGISHKHAMFELVEGAFRVRDLESTNGLLVNRSAVRVAELKHRDRLELGSLAFRYMVERRAPEPRTHVLPED